MKPLNVFKFDFVARIPLNALAFQLMFLKGKETFVHLELNAAVSSCYTSPFQIHISPCYLSFDILIFSL